MRVIKCQYCPLYACLNGDKTLQSDNLIIESRYLSVNCSDHPSITAMTTRLIVCLALWSFCAVITGAQDCREIFLETQSDVDAFIIDNPDCEIIEELLVYSSDVDPITNFDGLSNITTISTNLEFYRLSMQHYDGLDQLTTIGGNLHIVGNADLVDIDFLSQLTRISGDIEISGNDALVSIKGLNNPRLVAGVDDLIVANNPSLDDCQAWAICQYSDDRNISIYGNGQNCNSLEDAQADCPWGYIPTAVDSDLCTTIDLVDIDRSTTGLDDPVIIRDPTYQILCALHPRGNILEETTFELYLSDTLLADNISYCGRRVTIDPERQTVGTVLLRLYYTKEEIEELLQADSTIISVDQLRVSVALGGCDDHVASIVGTYEPEEVKVLLDSVAYYVDVLVDKLGTFYLHGPQDFLLDNDEVPVEHVKIYPNPVSDLLTVSTAKGMSYQILDLAGSLVSSGVVFADGTIDMGGLAAGVYVLKFDQVRYRQRIVKL